MVTVSVPGKIHLMGEHAVVYGKPALLAAINRRLRVTIETLESSDCETVHIYTQESSEYVYHILECIKHSLEMDALPPMNITISSDIPAGYHLGSSAAVAVATIGAVLYYVKKTWNPTFINKLAYEAEAYMHGNPSGGDNTAVTFGGIIWYRKELECLKSIWQLPFKPHENLNHFYLINTGKPTETTGEMVSFVELRFKNQELRMKKFFDENENQTKRIAVALKEGNEQEFIDAIKNGERTLESMGVVNKKISSIIRIIELSRGAAKILGGGGKKGSVGFLLAYHPDKHVLDRAVKPYGYSVEKVQLAEEGVRLEHHD